MTKVSYAEYLWLDGAEPTQKLRSKTRIIPRNESPSLNSFPKWGFDGSSTNQATGDKSDCELEPVFFCPDPIRGAGHFVVMCEVNNADGTPHKTNTRARLRKLMAVAEGEEPMVGFEQEYTMMSGSRPYAWPQNGFPAPQGPFYCGVGNNAVNGRPLVEKHMEVCNAASLSFYGINAEVMPSQWEFQIGPRDMVDEKTDPLTMADHTWIARYFLLRLAEDFNIDVTFDVKPVTGDWNGAGMHTNFSTKSMRDPSTGRATIENAVKSLGERHQLHIENYGAGLAARLTGHHETCSINEFRAGVSDRGASIRIPMSTNNQGYGYLEDRRPGANADPYVVGSLLLETVCNLT